MEPSSRSSFARLHGAEGVHWLCGAGAWVRPPADSRRRPMARGIPGAGVAFGEGDDLGLCAYERHLM